MSEEKVDDGGPAFPVGSGDMRDPIGMSLRAWLAGQALVGDLVGSIDGVWPTSHATQCADRCVIFADAIIERLKQ